MTPAALSLLPFPPHFRVILAGRLTRLENFHRTHYVVVIRAGQLTSYVNNSWSHFLFPSLSLFLCVYVCLSVFLFSKRSVIDHPTVQFQSIRYELWKCERAGCNARQNWVQSPIPGWVEPLLRRVLLSIDAWHSPKSRCSNDQGWS